MEEDKKLVIKGFLEEEMTKDKITKDKANLHFAENKCLGEVGNMIYLLDMQERDVIHNMDEQGTIEENFAAENEGQICLNMVRFEFIQRSLVTKVNRVLEVKANVMALRVLDRLFQVDWDSSRLTNGDEQSMEKF